MDEKLEYLSTRWRDEGLKLLVSEIDPAKMHNVTILMVDLHSMFLCLLRRFSRNKKERLCEQPLKRAPGAIRTHDPFLRREVLYPAELQEQMQNR